MPRDKTPAGCSPRVHHARSHEDRCRRKGDIDQAGGQRECRRKNVLVRFDQREHTIEAQHLRQRQALQTASAQKQTELFRKPVKHGEAAARQKRSHPKKLCCGETLEPSRD